MGSDGVMESHTEGPQWHAGKFTGQFTGHTAENGERAQVEFFKHGDGRISIFGLLTLWQKHSPGSTRTKSR